MLAQLDLSAHSFTLTILASKLVLIIAVLVPQMNLFILEQFQLFAHIFIVLLRRKQFALQSLIRKKKGFD